MKNLVSTFAGNGTSGLIDGPVLNASFSSPSSLVCQASAPAIFVMDHSMNIYEAYLRKIQNGLLLFNYFYCSFLIPIIIYLSGKVTTLKSGISTYSFSLMSIDFRQNIYFSTSSVPYQILSFNTTNGLLTILNT